MPGSVSTAQRSNSDRLLSIDALRGFDMFWIVGGDDLAKAMGRALKSPFGSRLAEQFEHVEWEGFRFYDLIFPLFLFLVGVVLPFSLGKMQGSGQATGAIHWRVVRRAALLFLFGLVFNNLLQFHFDSLRLVGVLQRIAICYLCAGLIMLHTRPGWQVVILAAILGGYWALMTFIAIPGGTAGDYSKLGNLSGYVDSKCFKGRIVAAYYGYGDNEGILSTIPAVGTALLGVLAGHWLRSAWSGLVKTLGLLLAGGVCVAGGWLWGQSFPIIKNIWTSSFVLYAGGWSLVLLAGFYLVIDVIKFRIWSYFFVVIGANAITIYMLHRFVPFESMSKFFLGGTARLAGDYGPMVVIVGVLILEWFLLLDLYRRRLFLRV